MFDQKDVYCYNVKAELKEKNNKFLLTYTPDFTWLKEETRVFPVILDPTVTVNTGVQDSYTYSATSYRNTFLGYEQQLKVGKTTWLSPNDDWDTYIRFTQLPNIPADHYTVDSALMILKPRSTEGAWSDIQVGAYEITSEWATNNYGNFSSGYITYNNRPSSASAPVATTAINRNSTANPVGFEIASLVSKWYQNPSSNWGVRLSLTSQPANPNDAIIFNSSRSNDKPYLTVTYTPYVPAEYATITNLPTNNTLRVGDVWKLEGTVSPSNATNQQAYWQSTNPTVAAIGTDGTITALSTGTTQIYASTADTGSDTPSPITITVIPAYVPAESFFIEHVNISDNTMVVNQTGNLNAVFSPNNSTNQGVVWNSSVSSVASIDQDGTVESHSIGTTVITATSAENSNISATYTLTVTDEIIALNKPAYDLLKAGDQWLLSLNPSTLIISEDPSIVRVDLDGVVTAVNPGKVNLEIGSSGNFVNYELTVTAKMTITGKPANDTLYLPNVLQGMDVSINPYVDTDVEWYSSDSSVADVSYDFLNGVQIFPHKAGTTVISATASEINSSAYFTLTVKNTAVEKVEIIKGGDSVPSTAATIYFGETLFLAGKVTPPDAVYSGVTWNRSNTNIEFYDGNFKGTYIKAPQPYNETGTTNITATAAGKSSANFVLTVKSPTVKITDTSKPANNTLYVGDTRQLYKTVDPSYAKITWQTSNSNYATVDSNGSLTAIRTTADLPNNSVTITVKATVGTGDTACTVTDTFQLSVKAKTVAITNKPANDLTVNDTFTLEISKAPSDLAVVWGSDKSNIVSVDINGKITAIGVGTATITVSAVNSPNINDTCTVTVNPLYVEDRDYVFTDDGTPMGIYSITKSTFDPYNVPESWITESIEKWNNSGAGVSISDPEENTTCFNSISVVNNLLEGRFDLLGLYIPDTHSFDSNGRATKFKIQISYPAIEGMANLRSENRKNTYINTITHELGHSFGLDDDPPTSYRSIMLCTLDPWNYTDIHACDIAGVRKYYNR